MTVNVPRKATTTEQKILLSSQIRETIILLESSLRILSVEDDLSEATLQLIEKAISDVFDILLNP